MTPIASWLLAVEICRKLRLQFGRRSVASCTGIELLHSSLGPEPTLRQEPSFMLIPARGPLKNTLDSTFDVQSAHAALQHIPKLL